MNNFILEEFISFFKRGVLWFILTVIFCTRELKEEALSHVYDGVVRIPGACYGCNLVQGYKAIGKLFPQRSKIIRLDYIMGYVKLLLLFACTGGFFLLTAQYLT